MIKQIRGMMAVGSLAVLLAACGGTQAVPSTAAPVVQQVTMRATEFAFTPNSAQLKVGQTVQLTIINVGQADHDIKSDMPIQDLTYLKADNDADEQQENAEQGVFDLDFNKSETGQVTFVPTKAGTYQFYCDEPGHKQAGMTGTFTVSE